MSRVRGACLLVVFALLAVGLVQAPPPAQATPGDLVASVVVPVPSSLGVSIAFDGTTFYYTNYGDPTLYGYTVSCAGPSCASTLTLAQPLTHVDGGSVMVDAMAWDGNRDVLWAGGLNNNVYRIDVSTGIATPAFVVNTCNPYGLVDGLAYDGVDDAIWFSSDGSYAVCKFSVTGTLLANIPTSSIVGFPSSCYNSGLAIGGGDLYMGSDGCGQIARVDKASMTGGAPFATPGGRDEDMECDPVTFAPRSVIWSKDAYDNHVTAFEIEEGTCGIGGLSHCQAPPLAVDVTRPAAFTRYDSDVAAPWGDETPIVNGDLTLRASSADDSRVAAVTWSVDGVPLGVGGPAPDFAGFWPAAGAQPGRHVLTAVFHDVARGCTHVATQEVAVPRLSSESLARAVFASTTHPVETTVRSPGADGIHGPSHSQLLDHVEPQIGLRAEALNDTATGAFGAAGGHATSVLSKVSLLGGRIQAEVLRAEAEVALNLLDYSTEASSDGSLIVGLTVDGTPVPVSAPDTVVDVPGVGRLVLLETVDMGGAGHRELRVNALHLYAALDGFRAEIILGQAIAGADVIEQPFVGRSQRIHAEDDAGTGEDVGDTPAEAHDLDLDAGAGQRAALLAGRLSANDPADHYAFRLVEGEKVVLAVKPSEAVDATTGLVVVPHTLAPLVLERADASTDLRLELRAPDGSLRLVSDAPLTAPERIELNADADGDWILGIVGSDSTNYTLAINVEPVAFAPHTPSGAFCGDGAAPLLAHDKPFVDDFRSGDTSAWFRVHANIGDDLTATLHPAEADAADFDLFLYDRYCGVLQASQLGKSILWDGDVPKGVPDAVGALPTAYTGDYWLEVRRIVGVGSWALVAQANTVIPTLPGNDALTGADASDDAANPTPLSPNAGAFEGRFEDGDPRDAYSFTVKAGQRAAVSFAPSALNSGSMTLQDANGFQVPLEIGQDTGFGAFALTLPAPADATWTLVVSPTYGGGNYVVTVAQG